MRRGVIALGVLVLIVGLAVLASGAVGPSFVFLVWGVIFVAGILFERFRYKPVASGRPGPGWERTTERFVDNETGQPVTVYIQPATGERMYVHD